MHNCTHILEKWLSELWLRLHNCGSVKENKQQNTSKPLPDLTLTVQQISK